MAKIYFKGNMPAIEVNSSQAEQVIFAMQNEKPSVVMTIGNSSFKVSEVKGVSNDIEHKDDSFANFTRDWALKREDFYKLSVDQKIVKLSGFFELIRKILQYDFPNFETKVSDFLSKNRFRLYPDIKMIHAELPEGHLKQTVSNPWYTRMLHHLGNIISVDREEAEKKITYREENTAPVQDFLS